jgi:hypothetical protein
MKARNSDEVTVSLSMKDFLKKFFDLWEEDAATLAGVLGYDSSVYDNYLNEDGSYMSDEEYINSKIESVRLLKGITDLRSIPESIVLKVEELEKQFGDKLKTSGVSHDVTLEKGKGDPILDKTEITIEELEVLKAASKEVEVLKSQMEALQGSIATKAKEEMVEVVKGYSFVTEDKQEGLVEFLLKSEGNTVVIEALEKARDAIAASILEESGTEGDSVVTVEETTLEKSASLVAGILKGRKV